jgi:hypothetical protein
MLRIVAVARVNEHFNRRSHELSHIDHAHGRKRHVAAAVRAGEPIDGAHPFFKEAEMRGLSLEDFAALIASKPDNISERELKRQQVIQQIEQADTPAALDAITRTVG